MLPFSGCSSTDPWAQGCCTLWDTLLLSLYTILLHLFEVTAQAGFELPMYWGRLEHWTFPFNLPHNPDLTKIVSKRGSKKECWGIQAQQHLHSRAQLQYSNTGGGGVWGKRITSPRPVWPTHQDLVPRQQQQSIAQPYKGMSEMSWMKRINAWPIYWTLLRVPILVHNSATGLAIYQWWSACLMCEALGVRVREHGGRGKMLAPGS